MDLFQDQLTLLFTLSAYKFAKSSITSSNDLLPSTNLFIFFIEEFKPPLNLTLTTYIEPYLFTSSEKAVLFQTVIFKFSDFTALILPYPNIENY